MAWMRTYDIATPDGSVDSPAEADDRMQEIKFATQERLDVDHYFPLTGTEVSDLEAGEHRKITLRTLSAVAVAALAAAKAYLYHLVTDGELYFKDAADNTIQLTSGGKTLSASLDMKDEDNMASDSNTHASTQQSIKAYTDAGVAAAAAAAAAALTAAIAANVTLSAYTNEDSDGNAMLKTHAYKAVTGGQVTAEADLNEGTYLRGYVDTDDNPGAGGARVGNEEVQGSGGNAMWRSFSFLVAEGEYFEITTNDAGAPTIRWKSFGTLSEPIDHN